MPYSMHAHKSVTAIQVLLALHSVVCRAVEKMLLQQAIPYSLKSHNTVADVSPVASRVM